MCWVGIKERQTVKTYKFEATVQEKGVIEIPEMAQWAHQQVEIVVIVHPASQQDTDASQAVTNFLDKWRGFLKDFDPDELKWQYLQEKHRLKIRFSTASLRR